MIYRLIGAFRAIFWAVLLIPAISWSDDNIRSGAEIQAQIDALKGKGGTVTLASGTYVLEKPVLLDNGVILRGAGMDKTILRLADNVHYEFEEGHLFKTNGPVILSRHKHDFVIRDLAVDGNKKNNPKTVVGGVSLWAAYAYRVERVHIKDCRGFSGLYINHFANRTFKPNSVPIDGYILDCVIEGSENDVGEPWQGYGGAMFLTAGWLDNVLVKGNICRNNQGPGIQLEDWVNNYTVEDNEIYGNGYAGIYVTNSYNNVIRDNYIHDNGGAGIHMEYWSTHNLICGNRIIHNGAEGISLITPHNGWDHKTEPIADFYTGKYRKGCGYEDDHHSGQNVIVYNHIEDNCRNGYVDAGILVTWPDNVIGFNTFGPEGFDRFGKPLTDQPVTGGKTTGKKYPATNQKRNVVIEAPNNTVLTTPEGGFIGFKPGSLRMPISRHP